MFRIRQTLNGKVNILSYEEYEDARFAFALLRVRGGSLVLIEMATDEIWMAT